jgi:hypothetical protein
MSLAENHNFGICFLIILINLVYLLHYSPIFQSFELFINNFVRLIEFHYYRYLFDPNYFINYYNCIVIIMIKHIMTLNYY